MFLEILAAVTLGVLSGIITGLIPGVHINLIASLLVSIPLAFSHLAIAVFIVAMAVTHTFLDTLPSIYLGTPSADTALGLLPGHELLVQGKGHEAVRLTVIGSLLGLLACIILFPFFLHIFPRLYTATRPILSYLLIGASLFMITNESTYNKRFWALLIFLLAGILGMLVWDMDIRQPLLPLLSGLFGVSMLLVALFRKVTIPTQMITEDITLTKTATAMTLFAATLSGALAALLPGLGSSQATVIASTIVRSTGKFAYLIIIGGVNTVNFVLSLATFYTLRKARNGAVASMMKLTGFLTGKQVLLLLCTALLTGGIATFLALYISKGFARLITRVNYSFVCIGVILFVTALVTVISGPVGFVVLAIATFIGVLPSLLQIGKRHCMGCLMVPIILYFLG